jgi:ADP-heptose:LPS heptosyltransferase
LFKSAAVALIAGAGTKIASSSSYGMKELSWLISKQIKPGPLQKLHTVDRHLEVIKYLTAGQKVSIERKFPICYSDIDKTVVNDMLKTAGVNRPYAVMFTGGGWLSRRWFQDRFAELADRIIDERNIDIVFIGGKPGGSPEDGIIDNVMSMMKNKAYNLSGKLTLKQLAVLIGNATFFVGNEAGPMHVACAINTPVVAIIGPTDPTKTGPFGTNFIVVKKDVDCGPCKERNCTKLDCMKLVMVTDVMNAINAICPKNP